jgi:DNA invertase Pin-like site-specific DNA recombinase
MRAAPYLRVSGVDQTTDNQRPAIEQLARARGLTVVGAYEEQASAAKSRARFDAMMRDAHHGVFAVLLVWERDRFVGTRSETYSRCASSTGSASGSSRSRIHGSTRPAQRASCSSRSCRGSPSRRERRVERIRAGLARAKAQGPSAGRIAWGAPRSNVR